MVLVQSICTPQALSAFLAPALRPRLPPHSLSPSSLRSDRGRRRPGPLPRMAAAADPRDPSGGDGPGEAPPPPPPPPLPATKPGKPRRRRGRRSEAEAVEDFVRGSLDRTFASIREQNPEAFDGVAEGAVMKEKVEDEDEEEEEEEEGEAAEVEKEFLVEEESSSWPLDADVGWGIRASEYFEQHPIKNVVGEDGSEIDWEGEVEDSWVKEINCLEWESFAFHPSPLVVLVFERYNRLDHRNPLVLDKLKVSRGISVGRLSCCVQENITLYISNNIRRWQRAFEPSK